MKEIRKNIVQISIFCIVTGVICGSLCLAFYFLATCADTLRKDNSWLLYFLPFAGILVIFLYENVPTDRNLTMHSIMQFSRGKGSVSPWIAPLVFVSTILAYICGGSLGRTGSGLQVGGGISIYIRQLLLRNFSAINPSLCIACGVSCGFTAMMNSPIAGGIFAVEFLVLEKKSMLNIFPALLSSFVTYAIARLLNFDYSAFHIAITDSLDGILILKVAILAFAVTLVGRLYCLSHKYACIWFSKIPNPYARIIFGTVIVIVITKLLGYTHCNGIGLDYVSSALSGTIDINNYAWDSEAFSWLWKIVLTSITLACGFRGGEIAPNIFIGTLFGYVMSPLIGISSSLGAAIGFIGNLSSVTNCTIAIFILGCELINFSSSGIIIFLITSVVVHIFSGTCGIYEGQETNRIPFKQDIKF